VTDGLLLVDKPGGISSHDAVDRVRRAIGVRKVGHAGTLDPMATGLLVMGVGRGTRLLRFLGELEKEYEGTARLGEETDTLDATGRVVRSSPVDVTAEGVADAMATFVGDIEQVPPSFSAVKVGGRRLYEAARKGEALAAAPRHVRVDAFVLTAFTGTDLSFRAVCSSGTYVRTLLADVGSRLGTGAHLTRLVRTRIGPFRLEEARPPGDPGPPLPLARAVGHLPALDLEEEEAAAARHGRCLAPSGHEGPYGVFAGGELIGVFRDTGTKSCPEVVLAPAG
jgi:tRNA pseudouridine55 synthase